MERNLAGLTPEIVEADDTVEVIKVQMLYLLLLLGALVFFILAALGVKTTRPVNWVAVGLAFWVLVPIIQMAQRV